MRALSLIAVAVMLLSYSLQAQENPVTPTRAVQGTVLDKDGRPVAGAAVELENSRTLTVRSFLTQQDGKYRFEELNTDADYRIRAMRGGVFGPVRKLSRFKGAKDATINLTIGQSP